MAAETILDCAVTPLAKGINLVEASAGTGKTYAIGMLVLRSIVELEIPIERILVVTFTKAATEELRSRIRSLLVKARSLLADGVAADGTMHSWARSVPDREAADSRLEQALASIDLARIYTIHSFCQQMLGDLALESGRLFDVELLADVGQARSQVVEDCWRRRLYSLPPRICGLVTARYPTPEALYASVAAPGMISGRLEPEAGPFAEAVSAFEQSFARFAAWWHSSADELFAYFLRAQTEGQLKKQLSEELGLWWEAIAIWVAEGESGLPANLGYLSREGLKQALNGNKVRKNRQDAFLADWPLPDNLITEVMQAAADLVLVLRREVAVAVQGELELRLREQGRMSFDELIIGMDRALEQGGGSLRQVLGERFSTALIDEFQDTDPVQWRIFSSIFGGGGHYLYLIGDPKQAIYRFRGADIFAYFAARRAAGNHLTLAYNYRSHPLLVHEVNSVFSGRTEPFGLAEDILPFHPVDPARIPDDGELYQNGTLLPVMIYCRLAPPVDEGQASWSSGKAAVRFREYVVSEVCRLLDPDNPAVRRSSEGATVVEEQITARDIAVLVRSNRQADEYLQAFAQAGLPAVVSSRRSVFDTEEARELLTLLQALTTPGDAHRVKRAMTISWFGLSGDRLLAIWQDEVACDDWFNRFLLYHQLWREKGFLAMMSRLLQEEKVYLHLCRQETAERRIANIHHLLELVQEAETAEKFGPDRTLVWLHAMLAGKSGEEDRELRLESDEQAVRIVTMHSAKGLQYPVVFCPFLWYRSDRLQGERELIGCHEDDGLVVDLGSPEFDQRRRRAMEEELAEDLRLAYVAVTRAELCCYVMWADVKKVAGKVASSHDSALGYLLFPQGSETEDAEGDRLAARAEHPGVDYRLLPAVGDFPASYRPGAKTGPGLAPLAPGQRPLHTDYQMSSYSAMAALSEQEDHGSEPAVAIGDMEGLEILHPGLPAGAGFGNLIHDALETLPFASLASGSEHDEQLARLCRRYGMAREMPKVGSLLATIVTTPLIAGESTFCLVELNAGRCISEMPFYFHLGRMETGKINEILAGEETVVPLSARAMQGYLTGFVDLVCESAGRFYVLDYKTNFLGNSMNAYRPENLVQPMAAHNYGLQYWSYTLVLHRHLTNVLPDYRYGQHFGGVLYLFVRGMAPGAPGNGVFFARPSLRVLERLDALMGGGR